MLHCDPIIEEKIKNSYKILIVEDSEFMSKIIATKLSAYEEYELQQAFTFGEAIEKLENDSFDFIILDLNLPDAYGDELLDEVKGITKAKVIVLTSEIDIQIRESLFKKGILDYLIKDKEFSSSITSINTIIKSIEKNKHSTVLVIDDSMFMCRQMKNLLAVRNYNTITALSGEAGLKALQNSEVNLIILDIELPDIHGLELLKKIKQEERYCHIPVIVLSGSSDPEIIRKSLKTGASDFIKKPFNVEEFTLKVDMAIMHNRKYIEVLCKQKMVDEYKEAVDEANIVTKTDSKGIITFANDKFCEISGYTKEELIGKPHNIVRHPDMPSSVFKEMWETIKAKKTWKGVIKNLNKNGSSYYVQSTIKPIVDYDGNIVEYIGIRTDITELETYKEILEEDLKISNNNINYLLQYEDAMNDYIAILKTNVDNTITYVNDNFCKLSQYSRNELLGKTCSDLRSKKHIRNGDCDRISKMLKMRDRVDFLFENRTKSGKRYYVDTKIYPIINEKDEVQEYLHIMYNVTELIELHKELEKTQKEIIYKLGEVGESRSQETGNHVKRVAEYSRILALLVGLGEKNAELLHAASPMHDIGKVAIPDEVLKKPGRLTPEEFEIMKSHAEIGYKILKSSKRPILRAAAIVAYRHHEKWDGTGYPTGLSGKRIHIFGRITAIADVFDALGSDRVYKKGWELERIVELFKEQRGKHFDPELVDLFLNNLDKFLRIREKFKDVV